MEEDVLVGGQAVIEGVLMRSPHSYAIAVREPQGSIHVKKEYLPKITDRYPSLNKPFLRGVLTLIQMLVLGLKALNYSANVLLQAEEGQNEKKPDHKPAELSPWAMGFTLAAALGLGFLLFFFLPLYLTDLAKGALSLLENNFAYNVVDGIIRVAFFILYILGISLLKDIKRIFQYHGAEHQVVHAFEAGEKLSVENARKHSPCHPRCGTGFLLLVMVVSILIFTLIPKESPFYVKLLLRLAALPLIAGSSYELIRLASKRKKGVLFAIVAWPGLLLQRLTTRTPTDDQLEVSLRALEETLFLEEKINEKNKIAVPGA
jgi:uncharacterized protein YqhQ